MTDRPSLSVVDGAGSGADTFDGWLAAADAFGAERSTASWAFADWLAQGRERWGRDAMRAAAEATGATPGKIRAYLNVSNTYPNDRRRSSLTFSHHLEVASLPEDAAAGVLDRAETEGWTRAATRAAAREASLEGKVRRQAQAIRALERQLAAAKADAGDAMARTRERLAASRRAVRDEVKRAATLAEELAGGELLGHLHGNARRGIARDMRRAADGFAADVNAAIDRIAAGADRIEGGAGDRAP